MKRLVAGKPALEIGGPTALFGRDSLLPVYAVIARLDNTNFSTQTIWEGTLRAGAPFHYDPRQPIGTQYIMEAADLATIDTGRYGVLLSSHTLEHVANPLPALREWRRVLNDDGVVVLVLPHKEGTFDHRRPVTTLAHLIHDEERGTTEDDQTHLPEILALHDLALDPQAGDRVAFSARSLRNAENRCLHHHVFDTRTAIEMVDRAGFQILEAEAALAHHIFIVARKPRPGRQADNSSFLSPHARYRTTSPFAVDCG